MKNFRISRRITSYEYCDIEAEGFRDALVQGLDSDFLESKSYDWKSAQLGDDYKIIGVTALDKNGDPGEDRDVKNDEFV